MNRIFNLYLLLNIPIIFILVVGFMMGILQPLFVDVSYITPLIFGITCCTVAWIGFCFWKFDHRSETFSDFSKSVDESSEDRIARMMAPLWFPMYIEDLVVLLGFLGTVVGVFVGFQHFPENAFSDPSKMQEFVRMMLVGFSVELHSLLMGLVCRVWLSSLIFIMKRRILGIVYG